MLEGKARFAGRSSFRTWLFAVVRITAREGRRQREVLHLVFYGELSIREASEVMNVSLGTARTHYERGKAGLRKRLGRENASNG